MENEPNISDASFATLWCLRFVVLLQGIGVWGRYFFSPNEVESDVYGLLYFDLSWSESLALRIDDLGACVCLVAGLVVVVLGGAELFFKSGAECSLLRKVLIAVQMIAALVAGIWMLALSITFMIRGDVYAELSLGEHAVRFVTPLALALLMSRKRRLQAFAVALLVAACGATFAVHGYKAMQLYGPFTDLILLTDTHLLGYGIEQTAAERMLVAIGVIDIVLALLFLVSATHSTAWRWVTIYLIIWAVITALGRMTAYGWTAWPDTLLRTANGGAPLVYVLWCCSGRSTPQFTDIELEES